MRASARGLLVASCAMVLITSLAAGQYAGGRKFIGPRLGLSGVGNSASIGAEFEVARDERIGIGGFADYWSYSDRFEDLTSSVSYLAFGATGSYHFEVEDDRWDPFVGLALGYFIVSYEDNFSGVGGVSGSRLFLGGQGGVRYFFKENTALVARAGFGAAYLSVGLDFVF